MTAKRSHIAWLAAPMLCALALIAPTADAAERVRMPVPWAPGTTLIYDTESIVREKSAEQTGSRRVTDRTEVRVEDSGRKGHALAWTTHDSQVQTIDGDRSLTDLIAPLLERLDALPVSIELDRDGRYRRVRNLDEVTERVRAAMRPVLEASLDNRIREDRSKVTKRDRDAALAIAREGIDASLQQVVTLGSVETMTSSQMRTFAAFVGKSLQAGKRYRDAEPIRSPFEGVPLPGRREYVLEIDRDDPKLARIRWTHALDTGGDAAAQWTLVAELTGETPTGEAAPQNLSLREEGVLVFRRDTGVIELLETVDASRYGERHDEHERHRMRLRGSARTWAQEEAVRGP